MSVGGYNTTFFNNRPDIADSPGVLYVIVLVNRKTFEREAVKIGITKGTNYRAAIKRAGGFSQQYDIRIQKLVYGTLEEVFYLEQYLHELWADEKYTPKEPFGGWTECFNVGALSKILKTVPDKP